MYNLFIKWLLKQCLLVVCLLVWVTVSASVWREAGVSWQILFGVSAYRISLNRGIQVIQMIGWFIFCMLYALSWQAIDIPLGKRYTCEFCKKNCQKKAIKTMDGKLYHIECFSCKGTILWLMHYFLVSYNPLWV